jgi:phage pi2 protein 07
MHSGITKPMNYYQGEHGKQRWLNKGSEKRERFLTAINSKPSRWVDKTTGKTFFVEKLELHYVSLSNERHGIVYDPDKYQNWKTSGHSLEEFTDEPEWYLSDVCLVPVGNETIQYSLQYEVMEKRFLTEKNTGYFFRGEHGKQRWLAHSQQQRSLIIQVFNRPKQVKYRTKTNQIFDLESVELNYLSLTEIGHENPCWISKELFKHMPDNTEPEWYLHDTHLIPVGQNKIKHSIYYKEVTEVFGQ